MITSHLTRVNNDQNDLCALNTHIHSDHYSGCAWTHWGGRSYEQYNGNISHSLNPKPMPGCIIQAWFTALRREKEEITVTVKQRNRPLSSRRRSGRISALLYDGSLDANAESSEVNWLQWSVAMTTSQSLWCSPVRLLSAGLHLTGDTRP